MKTNNLAGASIYSIDLDDFRGLFCKQGSYPFLKMSLGLLATWRRKPNKNSIEISPSKNSLNNENNNNVTHSKTKISIWNESRSKILEKMTSSLNQDSNEENNETKTDSSPKVSFVLITPRAIGKKSDKRESESKMVSEETSTNIFESLKKNKSVETIKKFSPLIDLSKKGPIISILNAYENDKKDFKIEPVALKLTADENSGQVFHSKDFRNKKTEKKLINSYQNKCVGKINGIYREEDDCSSFFVCDNKAQIKLHEFRCPEGLIFSMSDCTCDWPKLHQPCIIPLPNTLCKATDITSTTVENINITKTTTRINQLITKPIVFSNIDLQKIKQTFTNNEIFTCLNKQQGTYPDPYDCTKFYYCQPVFNNIKMVTHQFKCPHGLEFNVNICRCDWPMNNNCKIPNHIAYPCW